MTKCEIVAYIPGLACTIYSPLCEEYFTNFDLQKTNLYTLNLTVDGRNYRTENAEFRFLDENFGIPSENNLN